MDSIEAKKARLAELMAKKAKVARLESLYKKRDGLVSKESMPEEAIEVKQELVESPKKQPKEKLSDLIKTGVGMAGRSLVSAPGQLADIALLPKTIWDAVRGNKVDEGYAEKIKHYYDTKTKGKYKPTSNKGKLLEAALDFATPVGAIGGIAKGARMVAKGLPKVSGAIKSAANTLNKTPKSIKYAASIPAKPLMWAAKGYAPTVANLAGGTAGSVGLQHMINQDSSLLSSMPASIMADVVARKAFGKKLSDRRNIVKYVQDMPEGIKGTLQRSSLKIPEVKAALMESLPGRYGHNRNIGEYVEEAGKSVGTGISRYKKVHKQRIWNNLDKEIASEVDPIIANRLDPRGYVPVDEMSHMVNHQLEPLIGDFAKGIEKKAPLIRQIEEMKLMKDSLTPQGHLPYTNAKAAVKRMDNLIKKLEDGSPNQAQLTQARSKLQELVGETVQKMSPKAKSAWLKKNEDYSKYANDIKPIYHDMKPHMESYNKHNQLIGKGTPSELFNIAIADSGKNAGATQRKIHEALLESGQKNRAETFAKNQIKHLANKEQMFDPETLHQKLKTLKAEETNYLRNALPEKDKNNLEKLLDSVKGLHKIEGTSRELGDILHQNKIPTSWAVKVAQALRKGALKNRALSPEYQDVLAKRVLTESKRGAVGSKNKQLRNARIATQGRNVRRLAIEITKGTPEEEYKKERELD